MPDDNIGGLRRAYVLMGVADGTLLPFIPLYLLQRGLGAAAIGLVLAASALVAVAGGLGWAYLADRRLSPERLVLTATFLAAGSSLLMAMPGNAALLGGVIVVLSLARSPLALLDPITLRRLRSTSRTDYARIRLGMSAGWAVSVVIAGVAYQALGLRLIPFLYAPLSVLLGLWMWSRLPSEPRELSTSPAPRAGVRLERIPLAMLGFLGGCLLLGVALAATQNFLVVQISVLGGGAVLVGGAAAFQALTEIPTMAYMHVLTKHFGHRVLFAIGCAIYLVIFIAWAFVTSPLVAALLKLGIGVAFALTFVAAVMITNDLVPARLRATGQSLVRSALFGAAPVIGAFGGGIVYGSFGARAMFLASTVVVAAAGLVAVIVVPARKPAPEQEPVLAASAATP